MNTGTCYRWWQFLRQQYFIVGVLALGLLACIGTISYTLFLSRQLLACPSWALDCQISNAMQRTSRNIGLVQGDATAIYSIGLMCLVYVAQKVSEPTVWPLLRQKRFNIEQLETYLSAVRGSVMSLPASILFIRTASMGLILLVTAVVSLTPLSAAPLVGNVYDRENKTWAFNSNYTLGGSIGRIFAQTNPPVSAGAESLSSYIAWSRWLSQEPLPEYRDWLVDRSTLNNRGALTVRAVKTDIHINCHPHDVVPVTPVDSDTLSFCFETVMGRHNEEGVATNNSLLAQVEHAPALAVWVNDYEFQAANKTSATVVFAALNGTIEGGTGTSILQPCIGSTTAISSIACDVVVELHDDVLTIGEGGPLASKKVTISAMSRMRKYGVNAQTQNKTNEDALWLAVAPVLIGLSTGGAQPMYFREFDLPTPYTSTNTVGNNWTISEIEHFIRVSIGAVALAAARNYNTSHPEVAVIASFATTRKLEPKRVVYLVIPIAVILAGTVCLVVCNDHLHRRSSISIMKMASMDEILKSSEIRLLSDHADIEMKNERPAKKSATVSTSSEVLLEDRGLNAGAEGNIQQFSSDIAVTSAPLGMESSGPELVR